ncbi:hypothetical protein GMSM_23480 [Geomonas sp. Red276]
MGGGRRDDQRGFILIMLAGGLFLLLFIMAALAIDVGRGYVAKAELQNAADAAALAGVARVYPLYQNSTNWSAVEGEASNFVPANRADGKSLVSADAVVGGYWNYSTSQFTPRTQVPPPGAVLAVQVTIRKSSTNSNGPVPAMFAKVVGWKGFEPQASSIAALSQPRQIFPLAISGCLRDQAVNVGGPTNVTLTGAFPYRGSLAAQGTTPAGVWTSLSGTNTNANLLRSYIQYLENPADPQAEPIPTVKQGDTIAVGASGQMNSVYLEVANLIAAGKTRFRMPYVECPLPSGSATVVDFVEVELKPDSSGSNISGRLFPVQLAK